MSGTRTPFAFLVAGSLTIATAQSARADEGGVSFWLPGQFGSLAAAPGVPGLAFATVYYHASLSASGGASFPSGSQVRAGLDARADLAFLNANYISPTPILGGQAAFGLTVPVGRMKASVDAVLTGPGGTPIAGASLTDTITSFGDIYPLATLKWNRGVHNYMVYAMANIPIGAYNPNRLANLGIGHAAVDGGVGYTYFDPTKGHEFSIVTGFTYNFENPDTNYQNGVDWHVDWAASQFLSQQVHVGLVGYLYNQLGSDSGSGATLGGFHSRVAGIGPQIGYIFPVGTTHQGYLNLKGYWEFAAQHRPEGWNVWLTFAISPAAPREATTPRVTK
jgi:hypothetical protein